MLITLDHVEAVGEPLGLTVTLTQARRIRARLDIGRTYPRNKALEDMEVLQRTLRNELESRVCFALEPSRRDYYDLPLKGWESALSAFPKITTDVEEASKCFALDRYTASVFHLMRIMEVGLHALGASLNDPALQATTNRSWEAILSKCRAQLALPLKDRVPEWRVDDTFFSGASTRLMGVKDAWRNPTMHIEITYTDETALDVFNHVQAFMRHLATKLHE